MQPAAVPPAWQDCRVTGQLPPAAPTAPPVHVQGMGSLSPEDRAFITLANQVAETLVGVAVVRTVVGNFQPLPPDVLRIDFK